MMEEHVPEENHVLVVTGGVTDTLKWKHYRFDVNAQDYEEAWDEQSI